MTFLRRLFRRKVAGNAPSPARPEKDAPLPDPALPDPTDVLMRIKFPCC